MSGSLFTAYFFFFSDGEVKFHTVKYYFCSTPTYNWLLIISVPTIRRLRKKTKSDWMQKFISSLKFTLFIPYENK